MAALERVIAEAIVYEYGRDELLRRLAHPFWFQSFGAVMGMDWHSSGIMTGVDAFPVPIEVFDETIRLLKSAVARAKLGSTEALAAIQRLDAQARLVEASASGPTFESFIAEEWTKSLNLGGRTVKSP